MALFVLCGSATSVILGRSNPGLSEEDMRLSHFGSTSFLALMTLKKQISDDFDATLHTPSFYNELFFDVVSKDRKKELELLLIYMRTYQRDLRSKCKMAMLTKVGALQNLRPEELKAAKEPYFARCAIFAEEIFRRLHMNPLFFNLDFSLRSFRILMKNGSVMFYLEKEAAQGEESERDRLAREELIRTRNEAFLATLEVLAAESQKEDKERGWVARRFNMIDYFYGPHFPAIIGKIIDRTSAQIKRLIVELDEKTQELFDESFFVPQADRLIEKRRVLSKRVDLAHPGVDPLETHFSHLFRYYGASAYNPFYNVRQFHMWQQGQAQ